MSALSHRRADTTEARSRAVSSAEHVSVSVQPQYRSNSAKLKEMMPGPLTLCFPLFSKLSLPLRVHIVL
ncbi:unnamed protein product [Leuciscus chuanchicus]